MNQKACCSYPTAHRLARLARMESLSGRLAGHVRHFLRMPPMTTIWHPFLWGARFLQEMSSPTVATSWRLHLEVPKRKVEEPLPSGSHKTETEGWRNPGGNPLPPVCPVRGPVARVLINVFQSPKPKTATKAGQNQAQTTDCQTQTRTFKRQASQTGLS